MTDVNQGLFLVLVGRAQAPVWDVSAKHHIERKKPMPYVNHYSFHILDPEWGHLTIKGRAFCSPAIFRTMLVSEDGFDGLEIEWGTAAVDERLKHLFHVPAHLKDQVATVFNLRRPSTGTQDANTQFVRDYAFSQTGLRKVAPSSAGSATPAATSRSLPGSER